MDGAGAPPEVAKVLRLLRKRSDPSGPKPQLAERVDYFPQSNPLAPQAASPAAQPPKPAMARPASQPVVQAA